MQSSPRIRNPPSESNSLFLKIFFLIIWFEPFLLEISVGCLFMFFPQLGFVLKTFVPLPLLNALLDSKSFISSIPVESLGVSVYDQILFLIRFSGAMLFALGMFHHLLLRSCEISYRVTLRPKQPLFNHTILALALGDLAHIGIVLWFATRTSNWPEIMLAIVTPTITSLLLAASRFYYLVRHGSK